MNRSGAGRCGLTAAVFQSSGEADQRKRESAARRSRYHPEPRTSARGGAPCRRLPWLKLDQRHEIEVGWRRRLIFEVVDDLHAS